MSLKLIAAAACLAAVATPAAAKNVSAVPEQVAAAMELAGYTAEIMGDDGEERYISSESNGTTFAVFFFGCDDSGDNCETVQLYAGFTDDAPSLEAMNEYAAKKRWGRVYIDDEGDPVIEMDIDLEDGGMSEALFADNLEYWDAVLASFSDFIATGEISE